MASKLTFAVPVTWSQSNTYEANMIVFIGRKAYTALQNVPANTPITDAQYWKETGVPDAGDISDLESDVQALQTVIGDSNQGLVKDVADNSNNISSLETTVGNSSSGLVKSVADNTSDINSLESDMDNVKYTLYTPTN